MSKQKFDKKTVEHTAKLARMSLSDKEISSLSKQLGGILSYVEKLNKVNTDKIQPTTHVLSLKNIYREDQVKKSLDQDEALKASFKKKGGFFVVPKIIE